MAARLLVEHLIGSLRTVFGQLGDLRNGRNKQSRFEDIARGAFSACFMQSR